MLTRDVLECWAECSNYYTYPSHQKLHHNLNFRAVIIQWMMEIANDFKLQRQTTQSAINYLDRFYSRTESFSDNMHQILAGAALFTATKLFEPENELAQINTMLCLAYAPNLTSEQYTAICVKMMEVLNWELTPPTTFDWLCLYLRIAVMFNPALFKPAGDSQEVITIKGKEDEKCVQVVDLGRQIRSDLFREAIQLVDWYLHLCESVRFEPSRIAACAFWVACTVRMRNSLGQDGNLTFGNTVKHVRLGGHCETMHGV